MQSSNLKNQDDKAKFKKEFINRLIKFSLEIIKFSNRLREERIYWPLIDQLVRSATSIGANVVEAKSSSSRREYIKYFEIALKSANETKYWLLLVREIGPKFREDAERFLNETIELAKIIGSSVLTLKGKK